MMDLFIIKLELIRNGMIMKNFKINYVVSANNALFLILLMFFYLGVPSFTGACFEIKHNLVVSKVLG